MRADAEIVERLAFGAVAFFQLVQPLRLGDALGVFAGLCEGRCLGAVKYSAAQRRNRVFDRVEQRLVGARRDRQLQRRARQQARRRTSARSRSRRASAMSDRRAETDRAARKRQRAPKAQTMAAPVGRSKANERQGRRRW
jgi:hypothetical protein